MLESLPVVLVISTALGFLAGIGVGGGSLLIVYLTLVLGMAHPEARLINLLFFLPSALIATVFHRRQGVISIRKILPAILTGCIAAALITVVGKQVDTGLLKKIFGGLLLVTGIRELFYRPRKAK